MLELLGTALTGVVSFAGKCLEPMLPLRKIRRIIGQDLIERISKGWGPARVAQ